MSYELATQVSTPIALIAFTVAAATSVIKRQIEERRRMIEVASPEDRLEQTAQILNRWGIPTSNMTPTQLFNLFIRVVDDRTTRLRIIAVTAIVFTLISASTAIVLAIISNRSSEVSPSPRPPVVRFVWPTTSPNTNELVLEASAERVAPNHLVELAGSHVTQDGGNYVEENGYQYLKAVIENQESFPITNVAIWVAVYRSSKDPGQNIVFYVDETIPVGRTKRVKLRLGKSDTYTRATLRYVNSYANK